MEHPFFLPLIPLHRCLKGSNCLKKKKNKEQATGRFPFSYMQEMLDEQKNIKFSALDACTNVAFITNVAVSWIILTNAVQVPK